jgi:L-seryl-tRNA(Ser) seleniumtransferase
MLGGPQAGIIAGKSVHIARLRSNPLLRALRVDKLTLAALAQTLRLYLSPETREQIPFFAMLGASLDDLRARGRRYAEAIPDCRVIESTAYVGGGSLPESGVASIAVALSPRGGADAAAQALRRASTPIVGRIDEGRLLLDLRTISPADDERVVAALHDLPA